MQCGGEKDKILEGFEMTVVHTKTFPSLSLKKVVISFFIRVQAENENFSRGTFRNRFDPRIDLAPFFLPPGVVFTYLIGLLGSPLLAALSHMYLPWGLFCLAGQK